MYLAKLLEIVGYCDKNVPMEHRTSSSTLREVQRAEHVVAAKVDAFDSTERLELIQQLLAADKVDVKALGR